MLSKNLRLMRHILSSIVLFFSQKGRLTIMPTRHFVEQFLKFLSSLSIIRMFMIFYGDAKLLVFRLMRKSIFPKICQKNQFASHSHAISLGTKTNSLEKFSLFPQSCFFPFHFQRCLLWCDRSRQCHLSVCSWHYLQKWACR